MLMARRSIRNSVARICLQVHDEILWKRGPGWSDEALAPLIELCETGHGFDLDVPLVFECTVAQSWADKGGTDLNPDSIDQLNAELKGVRA
jgi:DNA polymerase I-like protein with 3'-5' exonuclease and polymerase domains